MNTVNRITEKAEMLIEMVATVLFLVFFVTLLLQVFTRYVLHMPLPWTEELARLVNVWTVSLGCAVAVKRNEHIRVSLFDQNAKKLKRPFYDFYLIATRSLIPLIILILFVIGSYIMVIDRWPVKFTVLPFTQGLLYLPLLIGSILMIIYLIENFCKKQYNGGSETE